MNRCTHRSPLRTTGWRIALIATLMGLTVSASAQHSVRPFPANALRGTLQVTNPPEVLLDGRAARMSPGARIRAENNLLVMSGALVGKNLVVNYVRDSQGMLHDVWLLNATEAQQRMPGAPAAAQGNSADYGPVLDGSGPGNATTLSSDIQQ